jgi:hypothetical protein
MLFGFERSGRISKFVHRKNGGNSCGAALEDSPRRKPWECGLEIAKPRRGERKCSGGVLSPLRGLFSSSLLSHGLRRGLPSAATPWLKYLSNFEVRPKDRQFRRAVEQRDKLFRAHQTEMFINLDLRRF